MSLPEGRLEWLETNQLGSFALGSVDRKLRRKYHALLTVRDPGRGDAWNVLAEVREELERPDGHALLADPLIGQGKHAELIAFRAYPHATHDYRALDVDIERSVRLGQHDQVEIRYSIRNVRVPLRVALEPLLRCRPLHELTEENPFLDGTCVQLGGEVRMLPYAGMPAVAFRVEGVAASFEERGSWLPVAQYEAEAERGYASTEALFCPGRFVIDLQADKTFTLTVALVGSHAEPRASTVSSHAEPRASTVSSHAEPRASTVSSHAEPRASTQHSAAPRPALEETASNRHFVAKLERAATQFFMQSATGVQAVIAGFPWFGAWSRDTLIALPGMYLATLDWERSAAVLSALANARVRGLVPNIPALSGTPVNTSSVDASLLYVRTIQWFAKTLGPERVARFMPIVCELLEALAEGQDPRMRFDQGIGVFTQPGAYALTWMDAMIDGSPVTPRAGYAVEIDALAYNAVCFACDWADAHRPGFARAFRLRLRRAEGEFVARYWDDVRGYLADGHDGHVAQASLRPNQLWALALPFRPVSDAMARSSLEAITRELWTPAGLRTLSPHDPAYRGHYVGTQAERDRAYHQGSVWPFLLGIYADAVHATWGWAALEQRLGPTLTHLSRHIDAEGCIGQISEIFDGEAPHAAKGAPAQAWSVAEVYRTLRLLHDAERGKTTPAEHQPSL